MAFFCVTPISADVLCNHETDNKNVVDVPALRRVGVQTTTLERTSVVKHSSFLFFFAVEYFFLHCPIISAVICWQHT